MSSISTPTQALKAELATRRQEGPDPVQPAPLEQIAQGGRAGDPLGQRFSFIGVPTSEGGAQAKANEPTQPTLDLPRVQTDVERPERNAERRNLQRLVQGLGALGAVAGAAGDSTLMTAVGAGLAQGAGQAQRQAEQRYQKQLRGYQQFVRDAREANRQRRRAEAQAEYEAALQDYKLDRQRQQSEREFQREKEMTRLESELDQPSETEKGVSRARQDYYEAGAEKRRAGARENRQEAEAAAALAEKRQRTGGEEGEDRSSMDELRQEKGKIEAQISLRRRQIQKAQSQLQRTLNNPETGEGAPEVIRERISRLQQDLDDLRGQSVALNSQINARAPQNGQSIPEEQLSENRETFMDTLPPGMRPGAGGVGGNQRGRQSPARDTTRPGAPSQQSRSQGRGDGGQSGSDPIRQAARQQAAKMDTVTQADIGAAVQQFGEGSDEVRILREVRRIQQSQ